MKLQLGWQSLLESLDLLWEGWLYFIGKNILFLGRNL